MKNHQHSIASFVSKLFVISFLLCVSFSFAAQAQTPLSWKPQRTWVFFVGLLEWQDSKKFGSFPQKNRRDEILLNVLRAKGVPENQILYLKDKQATTAKIQSSFASFLTKAQPGDWLFVYFCGHGFKSSDNKITYLASYDVSNKNLGWRVDSIPETIEQNFKGSNAILTLDNCYSGALAEAVKSRNTRNPKISYAVMTSSHFNSFSTANWTFTESLIYAFRGDAYIDEDADGKITLAELESNSEEDMMFAEEQLASFIFTGSFSKQNVVALSQKRAAPRVGERVEVFSGGGWYKGFITDTNNGKYKIRYYGYEESDDEWVSEKQIRQSTQTQYRIGSNVEVNWQGEWWSAKVLQVQGGVHYVAYDGFGTEWNEWVPSNRVREKNQSQFKIGSEIQVEWKGYWYRAKIIDVREGEFYVHYIGYERSWDEWVKPNRVKPLE